MELKIKKIIYLINGIFLFVITCVLISLFQKFIQIESKVEHLIRISGPKLVSTLDLKSSIFQSSTALASFKLSDSEHSEEYFQKSVDNTLERIKHAQEYFADNQTILAKLEQLSDSFIKLTSENVHSEHQHWYKNYPAIELSINELEPISNDILTHINDIYYSDNLDEQQKILFRRVRFQWVMLLRNISQYLSYKDTRSIDELVLYKEGVSQLIKDIKNEQLAPEQQVLFKDVIKLIDKYYLTWEKVYKLHNSSLWRKDVYYFKHNFYPEIIKINAMLNNMVQDELMAGQKEKERLLELLHSSKIMMAITFIIYLICLAVTWVIKTKKVINPIRKLNSEYKATIAELKNTQEKLVETEKMASLGSLVAGISHEINTPIGVSVTAASQLDEDYKTIKNSIDAGTLGKKQFTHFIDQCGIGLELMLINLKKASELISSFKRIAVDQTSEVLRHFDIQKQVNDVLLSLSPKLKGKNIQIQTNYNFKQGNVKSYPGLFSQILTNFINNSLIHGFDNGQISGNILITISKDETHNIYKVHYSDNGKGIKKDNLNKIIDPFFTTNRGFGGSGLGMHLVYSFVTNKLDSELTYNSEENQGVWFVFYLKDLGDEHE